MTCDFNRTLKEKNDTSGDLQKLKEKNASLTEDVQRLIGMLQKQTNAMLKEKREKEVFAKEIEQMKFAIHEGVKSMAAMTKVSPLQLLIFR